MRSGPVLVLSLACMCAGPGCSGAEKVTRKAVPAALDESVKFLEDPGAQRRIERLLRDPEVQAAAQELAAAVVDGAVAGMTDDASTARIERAAGRYIKSVGTAARDSLRDDVGPAAAAAAERAIGGLFRTALSSKTAGDLRRLADELTRSTADAMFESLGHGLQKDLAPALRAALEDQLGPGLRTVLVRDLGPAMREMMGSELRPAIGLLARDVTRQIVLGISDGLDELRFRDRFGTFELTFWNRLDALVHRGMRLSTIIAWCLGLVVVVLGGLLARALLLRRRLDEERLRSERMLLGVMRGLQQGSDKPDIEHFLAHLRERDPDLADDTYLDELSRRVSQPGRRYGRPRRRL